jgi:hypothetical protein
MAKYNLAKWFLYPARELDFKQLPDGEWAITIARFYASSEPTVHTVDLVFRKYHAPAWIRVSSSCGTRPFISRVINRSMNDLADGLRASLWMLFKRNDLPIWEDVQYVFRDQALLRWDIQGFQNAEAIIDMNVTLDRHTSEFRRETTLCEIWMEKMRLFTNPDQLEMMELTLPWKFWWDEVAAY